MKNQKPENDPMQWAFQKAPRCDAKTRKGTTCKGPAMKNGRCRMHGGKSPGGQMGNQNALKHGLFTRAAKHEAAAFHELIKSSKQILEELHDAF